MITVWDDLPGELWQIVHSHTCTRLYTRFCLEPDLIVTVILRRVCRRLASVLPPIERNLSAMGEMTAATAYLGYLSVLHWLIDEGWILSGLTLAAAVDGGHVELVEFLFLFDCPYDFRLWKAVASRTDLYLLEWFIDVQRLSPVNELFEEATRKGNLTLLKHLQIKGFYPESIIFREAQRVKNEQILQWVQESSFM